jgi:hypothetical protein
LREGNYQRLVEKCLTLIPEKDQQARLLDLLDAQGCVFLEQCWVTCPPKSDPPKNNSPSCNQSNYSSRAIIKSFCIRLKMLDSNKMK